jgi:glycerol-3-phosphate dehydrogenase
MQSIIIIGGGAIGSALVHDLTLRGFKVTLFEKGELLSGTTGRHHGLLHSGGRYVLHDIETARECWEENRILKDIVPEGLEQNDGLFVAINDQDMSHLVPFLDGCHVAGIPVKQLSARQALVLEPNLNPEVKAAVKIPDATMDAWRLPLHFFATARENGAEIRPFSEVVEIRREGKAVVGVTITDHHTHQTAFYTGDIIVNAAGPWAGKIAKMVDISIPVVPAPGVLVSVRKRLTNGVVNRLHPADDGDIILPQRKLSVLGTSTWLAKDPDRVELPRDHIARIISTCAEMVPSVGQSPIHATWSASRPLIVRDAAKDPTKISRSFDCLDHADLDGIEGFISVIGGKATTMRGMAEQAADLICKKTGHAVPCRTRDTRLVPYRRWYKSRL